MDVATRPWIITNLVTIVNSGLDKEKRDLSNANRALETLARLGGFLVERRESYSERTVKFEDLRGTREVNAALKQYFADVPAEERQKLLSAAPELAELVLQPDGSYSAPPEPAET